MDGFKKFLLRGNVVDLAVGVVVGSAFTTIVNSFVKDLLTPLIGAVGGNHDFSNLYFSVNNSRFLYGDFFNSLISFLIVSFVVYFFVVLPMNKLTEKVSRKKQETPSTKKCSECLSDIPLNAKRCAYCASPVV